MVTRMVPDPVAVHNERMKLLAGFFNALGIGLVGVGVLAPLASWLGQVAGAAPAGAPGVAGAILPLAALWMALGLALHGLAHYVLGRLKKAFAP